MDEYTIFHLNFVSILEEVAEHFQLEPPVVSTVKRLEGEGYQGAVHLQLTPDDDNSYKTIYGYVKMLKMLATLLHGKHSSFFIFLLTLLWWTCICTSTGRYY